MTATQTTGGQTIKIEGENVQMN